MTKQYRFAHTDSVYTHQLMILGQLFCRPMAYSQTREAFMT